jgi:hypothetical protein
MDPTATGQCEQLPTVLTTRVHIARPYTFTNCFRTSQDVRSTVNGGKWRLRGRKVTPIACSRVIGNAKARCRFTSGL